MTLKLSIHLNVALVSLKLATTPSYRECISQATKAIDIHSDPVVAGSIVSMTKKLTNEELGKAHYRRGMAYAGLKEWQEAEADLKKAMAFVPGDKAIEAELKKITAKKEEMKKKQQKAFGKMFG